jgi:enoyl-CoA hydratase
VEENWDRLDFVLGSVHFLRGDWAFDHAGEEAEFARRDVDEVYIDYYERIREIAESGLVDCMSHLDLVKIFGFRPTRDFADVFDATLTTIRKANLAMELSTAGWRKPVNELYPSDELIRQFLYDYHRIAAEGDGPLGCTRMLLSKPVIAAVEGFAVAGGLELALWCDLRVAARDSTFGVYCRRFGVPLIDGGTVRLPRLIGMSRAMDMILTGRGVSGEEAFTFGLANRLVERGATLAAARELAAQIAAFPERCMRSDRMSAYESWGFSLDDAIRNEFRHGVATVNSGETRAGAARFASGIGRHGKF